MADGTREVIVGMTGSGKTLFGMYRVSSYPFHRKPLYIFDMKGDKLIDEIGAEEISISAKPPKKPGLYVVRPLPGEEALVSAYLMQCWAQEKCGLYFDEGGMIPARDRWFRALLTQGRSKEIDMFILSQRPVNLDRYVFTEASYFAIFKLATKDDRKTVESYLDNTEINLLPRFHSLWYDVTEQSSCVVRPVPPGEQIIERFRVRLDKSPVKI